MIHNVIDNSKYNRKGTKSTVLRIIYLPVTIFLFKNFSFPDSSVIVPASPIKQAHSLDRNFSIHIQVIIIYA